MAMWGMIFVFLPYIEVKIKVQNRKRQSKNSDDVKKMYRTIGERKQMGMTTTFCMVLCLFVYLTVGIHCGIHEFWEQGRYWAKYLGSFHATLCMHEAN